jgi:hypothetical protein
MNGQFLSRLAMPQPHSCPNFSKSALGLDLSRSIAQ